MTNQVLPESEDLPPASNQDVPADRTEQRKSAGADDDMDVFWDEPADQDPKNPMNWSVVRKWSIVSMVSFITFLTYATPMISYLTLKSLFSNIDIQPPRVIYFCSWSPPGNGRL